MGHEAAVAAEPGERALDHPASSHDLESTFLVGALDDLQHHWLIGEVGSKLVAGIAAIGEDVSDEREEAPRPADETCRAITILNACRDHLNAEQQSDAVNDEVTLDTLYLLACIIADRILVSPPFSVAFTLCVSMMAALGEASRPSASRHLMSSS